MMHSFIIEKIKQDHAISGLSFRRLASKYGISYTRAFRIVKNSQAKDKQITDQKELPDDVALLKALLRKERLKTELLNNIIDIADKELGINIRKKSGTRRSE
jgi:molybdate-binding protein